MKGAALAITLLLAATANGETENAPGHQWGQWRGPQGTGVAPHGNPPTRWSEASNIRWKTAVPGRGLSSPVVWGDRIYLTASMPHGKRMAPEGKPSHGAHNNESADRQHEFVVLALDSRDGSTAWKTVVHESQPHEGTHETGSWASASPVTDGEHLFAFFGSNGLYALDMTGKVVWETDLGDMEIFHEHGEGSSPALDGDTMRLGRTLGGLGIRYVVVLDRLAPAPFSTADTAVPTVVADALGRQLDLRRLEGVNTAMDFYVNTEWTSIRAAASDGFDDGRETIADLASAPLTGTVGVLEGRDDRLTDVLPDGTELYLAQTHDTRWRLVVDGDRAGRRRSLEWATAFLPDRAGTAVLTYDTPWWRQAAMLVQIVAFSVALGATLRRRIGALR